MKQWYFLNFLLLQGVFLKSSIAQQKDTASNITAAQALDVFEERFSDVFNTAGVLFNPTFVQSGTPTANPYPTESIHEKNIDLLFGQKNLNIDTELLRYVKNFYFYLEYITKLEMAAHIAGYARQKNIDVTSTLETIAWKGLVTKAISIAGSWQELINKSMLAPQDWLDVKGSIVSSSWLDLIKTSFWQSIPVTPIDIIKTSFWQDYNKYIVCSSFKQDALMLKAITDVEKTIFRFIPNIEVAYYNEDFTQLRNSSEFSRLHLLLSDDVRRRAIEQCYDWKIFIDPKNQKIDMAKTYSAALEFQSSSDFYNIIMISQNTPLGTLAEQILTKKLPIDGGIIKKPLLQEKLLCLSMLKNLQAQLYYLFDKKHLQKTIEILTNNNTQIIPSIFLYQPEDSVYLADLADLLEKFTEQAGPIAAQTGTKKLMLSAKDNEQVVIQDFGSWLSDSWGDVKKTSKDAWQGIQDAGKTALDEIKAIGLGGAAAIVSSVDPKTGQELIDKSKELQEKVSQDIANTIADAQTVINDTATLAKDATKGAAAIVGKAFAKITGDKKLGGDIEGALESLTDVVVSFYAGISHVTVASVGGLVRLGSDAVSMASTIITDSIIAIKTGDWQALGADALSSLNNLAYNLVSGLLSVASFVVQTFVDQLKALIKFAGYLVSMITDITLDISKGILNTLGSVFDIFGWQAGEDAMQDANQWMESHRRLIETTVTTGLLLAAVVATDGAALPLIAMTIGPQLFQEYGSYQNDERSAQKLAEEKKFINDYQIFVTNNKNIAQETKNAWASELNKKYTAQAVNMQRNLGFYQNFTHEYLINTQEQMSYYMGQYLIPLITPGDSGLMPADVGSIYGFKTNVLNLNPSQGFPLYCQARNAFSQEIAVYPALALTGENNNLINSKVPRKFWFNQKETLILDKKTDEVEIAWQALYTLNQFYIGLYFGGESIDLSSIKKTGSAPLNSAHLAKMLVYTKKDRDSVARLQLYEHEGKGWFDIDIKGPSFVVGSWYHMSMRLEGNNLIIWVWKEGEQRPAGQQFIVKQTEQKTIGIISAGASIEYKIINPLPEIQAVDTVRKPLPLISEKDREFIAQKNLKNLTNPVIGNFSLKASSLPQILRGHYIYGTELTKMRDTKNNLIDDYIVLAHSSIDRISNQYRIVDIGISPQESPTAFVSLVTSKAYDLSANYLTVCQNIFEIYEKKYGSIDNDLKNKINDLKDSYIETLLGPFGFGSLVLTLNRAMAKNAQYIYRAVSPASELRDKQGNALKDDKGQLLYDYFVTIRTDERGNEFMASPFDSTITRIRSLVTGNEYGTATLDPIEKGHRVAESLKIFQQSFGNLSQDFLKALNASKDYYQARVKIEESSSLTPTTNPVQETTISDTGSPGTVSTSTTGGPLIPLVPVTQDESIQQRTASAAAQEESWG